MDNNTESYAKVAEVISSKQKIIHEANNVSNEDADHFKEDKDEKLSIFCMVTSSDIDGILFAATSKGALDVVNKFKRYYGDESEVYYVNIPVCKDFIADMRNKFKSNVLTSNLFQKDKLLDFIMK